MAMAKQRKKNEFRPDRTHTGLLSKLFLTQKQRKALLRWGLFALTLVVMLAVQDTVLCRLRVFGATTDLVPCGILLVCLFQTGEVSCVFALAASLVYLFSGSAPGAYVVAYLTFLGFGASAFRQSYLRKGFSASLLCTVVALLIYEMAVFAAGLATGMTLPSRAGAFVLTWALTLPAIPITYPIFSAINKIGGETWKE